MCLHLTSPIQSIFIRFKSQSLAIILMVSSGLLPGLTFANQADWVLSGTFLSDTNAHAMFVDKQGGELVLALGDKIQGCELVDVLRGSAKLNCGEKFHTLHLRNSVGEVIYPENNSVSTTKRQLITLSKESVLDYIKERQRLVSEISLVPFIENQRVIGFEVTKVQPFSTISALGLYNGDIITSVNGVPASQPDQFLQMVNRLSTSPEVSIEVDRYGQTLAYTYILE